jgi:hypothetical protein
MMLGQLFRIYESPEGHLPDPGDGGTINTCQRHDPIFTISGGTTRKLPSLHKGARLTVVFASTVEIQNPGGTAISSGNSGDVFTFIAASASTWRQDGGPLDAILTHLLSAQGFIALPLTAWREVVSNDIGVAADAAARGSGSILATDTTPTLELVNGDTDSQIRVLWATGNTDALTTQITLPPDLDRTADIVFNARVVMSGTDDTPVLDLDTFFDEGDTKVEDQSAAFDENVVNVTITIAAADIPDTATTMSVELTPSAHATDTIAMYATWLTYTKKLLTS